MIMMMTIGIFFQHEADLTFPPPSSISSGIADISLTVLDPDGRCAGMLVYGSQVAIIPFRRDTLWKKVRKGWMACRPGNGPPLDDNTTAATASISWKKEGSGGAGGDAMDVEGEEEGEEGDDVEVRDEGGGQMVV